MSNKLPFMAALLLIVAIAASIPFIGRAEDNSSSLHRSFAASESKVRQSATITSADDEPQVISLQLNPSGFEPAEMIAHRGKFLILLQNRSGQRGLNFWLARENQERLAESDPQKRDWKAQVQLGPGTYVIGESSHPEWKAIIRVSN